MKIDLQGVCFFSFSFLIPLMYVHQKADGASQKPQYNEGCDNRCHDRIISLEKMISIKLGRKRSLPEIVRRINVRQVFFAKSLVKKFSNICRSFVRNGSGFNNTCKAGAALLPAIAAYRNSVIVNFKFAVWIMDCPG